MSRMGHTAAWPYQGSGWMSYSRQYNKGFIENKEKGRSFVKPLRFTLTQAPARQEVQGEIRIKSLDEILKEKAARSLAQAQLHKADWCGTKGPSPTKSSATPPGAILVKTPKLHLGRKRKLSRDNEEELMWRREGPREWEVPCKKAARHPGEIRVKTLEEIRKEKAARMQTTVQEVKAEESPAPMSAVLKRRILRLNRNMATAPARQEVQGEIGIKSLDEIPKEKVARLVATHEADWCGTKGPSPTKSSATPPGAVLVETPKLQLGRKRKLSRDNEEELMWRKEGPPEWEVPCKKAARHPAEIRVKTLEEIRKEKAARMQTTVQEVKAEESPAPLSAPLKRWIRRIRRNMATGADSGCNTSARKKKPATPGSTENGAVNGKTESLVELERVKTFQEIMPENINRSTSTAEQSSTSTEPLHLLAKDPPAALQSSSTRLKSHRQCTAIPHTFSSAPLNFDELRTEFPMDMRDGEKELAMSVAELILRLWELINSSGANFWARIHKES